MSFSPEPNLRLGILALQLGYVSQEALIAALHSWATAPNQSLAQVLQDLGSLTPQQRDQLEAILAEHLARGEPLLSPALMASGEPQTADGICSEFPRTGPTPWPPLPGQGLLHPGDRYRPVRLHREGGLGEVFVAEDAELHREVALKRIKPHLAHNEDLKRRFILEAELTGTLEHPGVVPIYGLGIGSDGRPCYAMRFIHGTSLLEEVQRFHKSRDETPPGERALLLRALLIRFVAVCNAIAYAHSRGVIHRDLKPANIMLGPFGETLVVDWGLAKRLMHDPDAGPDDTTVPTVSTEETAGATQGPLGTPAYMSPEQARGDNAWVGTASDIYGLGATLYHLLSGAPPLERAPLPEMLAKVQEGNILSARLRNRNVPAALDAICQKAMAKLPKERYATASALASDIERWLADEPVSIYREPLGEKVRRWVKRRRTAVLTGATGGLLALVILAVSTVLLLAANQRERAARFDAEENGKEAKKQEGIAITQRGKAEEAAKESNRLRGIADEARSVAEASEQEQRRQLYATRIGLAHQSWEQGQVSRALQFLRGLIPPSGKEDLRGFEWYYLWRLCNERGERVLHGHHSEVTSLCFSPDGKTLATGCIDGTAFLWDVATGHLRHVLCPDPDDRSATGGFELGVQGEYAVLSNHLAGGPSFYDDRLKVGDRIVSLQEANGEALAVTAANIREAGQQLTGPAGSQLVIVARRANDSPFRVTLTRWQLQSPLIPGSKPRQKVVLAFDRTGTLAVARGNLLSFWDPTKGKKIQQLARHKSVFTTLAFDPTGAILAAGSLDGLVRLIDKDTQKIVGVLSHRLFSNSGHQDSTMERIRAMAFSPDGRELLVSAGLRLVRWDVQKRQEIEEVSSGSTDIDCLTFHPDGKSFAVCRWAPDRNVEIWATDSLRYLRHLPGHSDRVGCGGYTADGTTLVTGSADTTVRLWNFTGDLPTLIRGHRNKVSSIAWSPDNRLLASADNDGTVILWRRDHQQEFIPLKSTFNSHIQEVACSSNGRHIVTSTLSGMDTAELELWNVVDRTRVGTLQCMPPTFETVHFSPDGKTLAVSSFVPAPGEPPGECILYDVASGRELRRLQGHRGSMLETAFAPDGKTLLSWGGKMMEPTLLGEVHLWDSRTGKLLRSLPPHRIQSGAKFTENGKTILSWETMPYRNSPRRIYFWDAATGQKLSQFEAEFKGALVMDISPDGQTLVAVTCDPAKLDRPGEVQIWDRSKAKKSASLAGHKAGISVVAFAPDGKTFATGDTAGTVRVWTREGKLVKELPKQGGMITSVQFSRDSSLFACGVGATNQGRLRRGEAMIWETKTWKERCRFILSEVQSVSVGFSPNARRLATGTSSGGLTLWDIPNNRRHAVLRKDQDPAGHSFHLAFVTRLAISPDGKTLASGSMDGVVKIWDLDTAQDGEYVGKVVGSLPVQKEIISCLTFSPDGKRLVVGTGGYVAENRSPGKVFIWDLEKGKIVASTPFPDEGVGAVTYLPDGRLALVTMQMNAKGTSHVLLLNPTTAKVERTLHSRLNFLAQSLSASPDGRRLAWNNGDDVVLLDLQSGKTQLLKGHFKVVRSVTFSPDSKTLASSAEDRLVKFWQVSTGLEMMSLKHPDAVKSVVFSNDGRLLVSGTKAMNNGQTHLWLGGPTTTIEERHRDPKDAGYAREIRHLDERGRIVEWQYRNTQNRLTNGTLGYARVMVSFEGDGPARHRIFEDAQGRRLPVQVVITSVQSGGLGDTAGLRVGDVLLRYNGKAFASYEQFVTLRLTPTSAKTLPLRVQRGDQELTLQVSTADLKILLRNRVKPEGK